MKADLHDLFQDWPYDYEDASKNFRLVKGDDGRLLVQVREPLGIQQIEYMGRPDGELPMGKESWLEYFKEAARLDPHYSLSAEDCAHLIQEGILFYQRYIVLYQI